MTTTITFEPMTPAHLDGALALSTQVGWPHRRADLALALSVSQGVVGLDGGRVIATILMTPYGDRGATINSVIVDAGMRGLGLGRRLMTEALALADTRICRLVATQDGLPLYEKLGFAATGTIVQHQGEVGPVAPPDNVTWAAADDFELLVALDLAAFGHERRRLMQALRSEAKFAVIRDAGEVHAFATIRDFGRGQVIGPVVARSDAEARQLIDFLLVPNQGRFVRLDTNAATGLAPWLVERGLVHVGGGVAMIRPVEAKERGGTGPCRTFAMASQALG